MSNMFGGIESFQKYMDTEVTSSIKVSDGSSAAADPAPVEPVEVLEDNAVTDEKMNQDMADTSDEITEDTEAVEGLGRILVQQMEVRDHLKKHTLTADTYAFLNASYKFRDLALSSGKMVPSNEEFSPSSATHRKLVMEASDGMISKIKDRIIQFFKTIWENLKKFGSFLMGLIDKAASKLGELKNRILKFKNAKVKSDEATARLVKRVAAMVAKQRELKLDELNRQLDAAGDDPEAYANVMNQFEESMKAYEQGIAERKGLAEPAAKEELSGAEVIEVIEAAESAAKDKNAIMKFVDSMKRKVESAMGKLRSEEDKDKVAAYQRLGARISKATTAVGNFFSGLFNSASQLGNRALQLFSKQETAEGSNFGKPAEEFAAA